MYDTKKLQDLIDDMDQEGVLEDRREYDAEMLATMYDLEQHQAEALYALIQSKFK
jgi:hypothetical protein